LYRRIALPNQKLKLLVVDDDDLILQSIRFALPENWVMVGVKTLEEIPKDFFHAAFVDMHLTGDITKPEGLKVVKHLSKEQANLEIVTISGDLDRDLMEECLKAGATRFLAKPLTAEEIHLILEKIEYHFLLNNATLRSSQSFIPWIGSSKQSSEIKRQIADLAGEPGPILIEGESGTGKEVVSKLLYSAQDRRPFISVNVAALPEAVFESEVFGHVKGAFTGADQNKMGLAEAANGGDLFLDEIEALPLGLQAKLLRFLENGEVRRVGSKDSIKVNARVIVATNRNLEQMVKDGKFREDLMWRLNGKKLILPPLRERKDDIAELAKYFLDNEKPRRNKNLSDEAISRMKSYDWPGNVRELKRVCEQLCFSSPLPIIRSEDVDTVLKGKAPMMSSESIDLNLGLSNLLNMYEKRIIEKALEQDSDIDAVAKILAISRSSLYKKISDYSIEVKK
jgi:DNA-binding NtrC family response regulator